MFCILMVMTMMNYFGHAQEVNIPREESPFIEPFKEINTIVSSERDTVVFALNISRLSIYPTGNGMLKYSTIRKPQNKSNYVDQHFSITSSIPSIDLNYLLFLRSVDPNQSCEIFEVRDLSEIFRDYPIGTSAWNKTTFKGANCYYPVQRIQVKIDITELIPEFNYEADLGGGNILVNGIVQIIEPVDFIDLSQGEAIIWNWDFGDGAASTDQNPQHIFTGKEVFTVTLTTIDKIGCISTYQRVIEVRDDYTIIIPNAFTPNGVKNQYFKPQYRGIASMEFYVFNSWGELIFESDRLDILGWDGMLNGKETPNGNYVYTAIFKTRSGEKVGVFILIR